MNQISKLILFIFLGGLTLLLFLYLYKPSLPQTQKNQILIKPGPSQEEQILSKLTLEQKIGQMLLIGFEGQTLTPQLENLIKTIHPGGVLLLSGNIEDENQLEGLISDLQRVAAEDTGLPLFIAVDQEGGPVSRIKFLKELTPQSKIKDTVQAYRVGLARGKELKELGVNLNLGPVLDIAGPGDFLFERSFKKDAQTTGELAKAIISGQKEAGIFTAAKHYPGYGGISFNPERVILPVLTEVPEVSQFKEAFEAKPKIIMTANVIYTEIDDIFPFTLSSGGINFLKEQSGNDFLIISDDLSSPVLKKEFSLEKTIVLAVKAGIDILIVAGFDDVQDPLLAFNFLLEAVKSGEISEEKINSSVLRIIQLKPNMLE